MNHMASQTKVPEEGRKTKSLTYKTYGTLNIKHYTINCITHWHINYGMRMSKCYEKWANDSLLRMKGHIQLVIINAIKFNGGII